MTEDELFLARIKAENIVKEHYEDYNQMEADAFVEGYLVAIQYHKF